MFVHGVNVGLSDILQRISDGNACIFYFLNILIDTTLGRSRFHLYCLTSDSFLPSIRCRSDLCYTSCIDEPPHEQTASGRIHFRSIRKPSFRELLVQASNGIRACHHNHETRRRRTVCRMAWDIQNRPMASFLDRGRKQLSDHLVRDHEKQIIGQKLNATKASWEYSQSR